MFTIGLIDYLNTQPFQHSLAARLAGIDVDFVRGVPTELNRALLAGEIDLAPISSIEAARHAGEVLVLPGLGIASRGAVKTVLLFSWRADMRELADEPLALTDQSATSSALLQWLLRDRYGVAAQWRTRPQDLAAMMKECSGALVIGDTALVEGERRSRLRNSVGARARPFVFDLGEEWFRQTGLPFVFALWAVRREAAAELRRLGVSEALAASTAEGLAALDAIAGAYAPRLGLPAAACASYLRALRFHLDEHDWQGLTRFLDGVLGVQREALRLLGADEDGAARDGAPSAVERERCV